jgi:DNA-binding response OmpR family regulator
MRILLVEDDPGIASAITKHLTAVGYTTDLASDGLAGEELAFVNNYDVIILDIMLPKQDGWTTCSSLRTNGLLTPIIMLTALDGLDDKVRGFDCGADDYLAKPFHAAELLARLRSLARRDTHIRSSVVEKYGLRLDLNGRRLFRDDIEISLTAKEFVLFELLFTRADAVVRRETIIEHLWGSDYDPQSNVLESFIRLLRQKIDRGSAKPLIHTVRGVGYKLSGSQE